MPTACGSGGTRESNGRVEVRFWHAMSGSNGTALQKMVDGFNSSQSTYHVTAIYQGGYPDLLKKLVSSFGTNSMPAMIQTARAAQSAKVAYSAAFERCSRNASQSANGTIR